MKKLLVLSLLLFGTYVKADDEYKFNYLQRVCVIDGFYKDTTGFITGYDGSTYEVLFITGKKYIEEKNLTDDLTKCK